MQEKVLRCFFPFLWQPWGIFFSCLIDWMCPGDAGCNFQRRLQRQGGDLWPPRAHGRTEENLWHGRCTFLSFVLFLINLFIFYFYFFGCVGSLLLRVGFLWLWQAGATLHCSTRASHCGGFSCCGARTPGARTSVVVARGLSSCGSQALEHRLSSCGALASLLRGMWDLPGPGLEPMCPALAGGFLTTAPPGKPLSLVFVWMVAIWGCFAECCQGCVHTCLWNVSIGK